MREIGGIFVALIVAVASVLLLGPLLELLITAYYNAGSNTHLSPELYGIYLIGSDILVVVCVIGGAILGVVWDLQDSVKKLTAKKELSQPGKKE